MLSDDHICFWIFSRYSIDVLLVFFKCSLDVSRMFAGFFQDVFRMLSGAPKFSISVLRYVKGVFGCSLMFRYVQRSYHIFLDVLRCSQMFPDHVFPGVRSIFSRCSQDDLRTFSNDSI